MQMFLYLVKWKKSVDHDQEQSALFAYAILSEKLGYEILGHLPYVSCYSLKILMDISCVYLSRGLTHCGLATPKRATGK